MDGNCIVLIIFGSLLKVVGAPKTVGPFDASLTDVRRCPEPSVGVDYTIKIQKISRQKLVVFSNVSIKVPIDDELEVVLSLAKQTSQGWKENFFSIDAQKACKTIKQYVPALDKDIGTQLKTPGNTCPYPVGNYSLALSLQFSVGVFPMFPYGKYRAKVNFLKYRKRIFCAIGFVDIIPKKAR